jgi:hypothetical protein
MCGAAERRGGGRLSRSANGVEVRLGRGATRPQDRCENRFPSAPPLPTPECCSVIRRPVRDCSPAKALGGAQRSRANGASQDAPMSIPAGSNY